MYLDYITLFQKNIVQDKWVLGNLLLAIHLSTGNVETKLLRLFYQKQNSLREWRNEEKDKDSVETN